MRKRLKVFQAGKYPQGEFSAERVSQIFGNLNKVEGIYAHTSKWEEKGEQPLTVAEFSNFKVENGVVTADCEFNEKGDSYYNDKVLRGVSVEIAGDTCSKIALLPIGVKPAVAGAEFEEAALIEFEEVEENKLQGILDAVKEMNLDDRSSILTAVLDSLTNEEKDRLRKLYWADFEEEKKDQVKAKTEEEIRAEIVKEFEDKEKARQLKEVAKTKVIPCLQSIVEFAIDKAIKSNIAIEFEENGAKVQTTEFEKLKKDIEALPKAIHTESDSKKWEFGKEETTEENYMEKAFNETKKILGGK